MEKSRKAFSLAETIVALTVGSMILITVLVIYNRIEKAANAVERKLDSTHLPSEVLQRIAEDLDRIAGDDKAVRITVKNKYSELYASAQLTISKTIYDKNNKKKVLEEIIWQSSYDYDSNAEGLVLYRSYSGIAAEDKLLDDNRQDWEKDYSFVPVCSGVTFFRIEIADSKFKSQVDEDQIFELELPEEEELQKEWSKESLPNGLVLTISFAEPFKEVDGTFNVEEDQKIKRTIAIDRTRKIKLIIPEKTKVDDEMIDEEKKEDEKITDSNIPIGP